MLRMDAFGFIKPGLASPRSSVSNPPFGASVRATPVPTKPRTRSQGKLRASRQVSSFHPRRASLRHGRPLHRRGGTSETRRLIRTRRGERESKGSARKCTQAFELNKKATSRGCACVRVCLFRCAAFSCTHMFLVKQHLVFSGTQGGG